MTDVWEDLGRALGHLFAPLFAIPRLIWKGLGESSPAMIEGMVKGAENLSKAVAPTLSTLMPNILDEATAALGEESPPKEIKDAVDKMILQLTKKIEKESKTTGHSIPTLADVAARQASLIAGVVTMYAVTHAVSMALDATHPLKEWGFKTAIMDILYEFKMEDVIGPMIQAPIWAGVVLPMRLRYAEMYPYDIPASGTLPYLKLKGIITDAEYKQNMAFRALDAGWADKLEANALRYPDWGELRTMIHMGVKTWEDAKAVLKLSLISTDYVNAYEKLLPSVPGTGDLVSMAVREAYQARSGDEEMSERFVTEMAKWGFDKEACLWFWRKHWELPSVGQIYSMNHRAIAMPQTVKEFLKWADYAPEWRGPLEELSYNLPGRIDARWMVKWGELDVDELEGLLKKAGLAAEWAPKVARATTKNQFLAEINKLRDNKKSDYVKGYILEDQLRTDLTALGYSSEWVEFHVRDATEDGQRALNAADVTEYEDGYQKDLITEEQLMSSLSNIIVRPEVLEQEMSRLYVKKYKKLAPPKAEAVKTATLAYLATAYRLDVLTEADLRAELVRRLYLAADIETIMAVENMKKRKAAGA